MTSFGQKDVVAMPERCECGHNKTRHMLAGFDGACIATDCRCRTFRPVEHAATVAQQPVGRPAPARLALEQLLAVAGHCGDRRTELVAEKIRHEVDEIRARLAALRAKARADLVAVELKAAKKTKARRKAERRSGPGTHPCTRAGCDRTFGSGQARSLHERRTHDGFNPHAAKASA